MVSAAYIQSQLDDIKFGKTRWNKAEIRELQHILITDEKILECVNGYYEGGVALLVATDIRVLLIDKKMMGFLNVEDLRFDLINEIDYSHQMFSAQVKITGLKKLVFKSYNQQRLRKLVSHIQSRMSEIKKEQAAYADSQKQHLEEINRQLQMYLYAQQRQLDGQSQSDAPQLTNAPSLAQPATATMATSLPSPQEPPEDLYEQAALPSIKAQETDPANRRILDEMVRAGRAELNNLKASPVTLDVDDSNSFLKIAYAKLPYVLRHRRRLLSKEFYIYHPST